MSIVVYTHDQLDIYTIEIGKFSRRADDSIYIFIYIEERIIVSGYVFLVCSRPYIPSFNNYLLRIGQNFFVTQSPKGAWAQATKFCYN